MRYVESLNNALHDLLAEDERVFVLGEDILDPYGGAFKVTKGLSTKYPDRVITTPISESSLTGFVTGMAIRGLHPILEIMFGDFITLCTDQLINSASKFSWMYNGQVEVPMTIRTPMGGRRGYGATHSQTLETLFLNVPGLSIVAPSHFHHPGNLLRQVVLLENHPVLFIENKSLYPQHLKNQNTEGRVNELHLEIITTYHPAYPSISLTPTPEESPDVTLVAYGGMALPAAEAILNVFKQEEIIVELILPSLIKPFPLSDILASVQKSRQMLIVEESVGNAGWGAILAGKIYEAMFNNLSKPICCLGSKEVPIPSSKPLENEVLLQASDIETALVNMIIN